MPYWLEVEMMTVNNRALFETMNIRQKLTVLFSERAQRAS